jgi:hypothetical protein
MAKTKFYHLIADAVDSDGVKHKVTVVGKFEQRYIKKPVNKRHPFVDEHGKNVEATLVFNKRVIERTLTIGVAICNPTDRFSEEEGIKIAKKRIEEGKDAGKITTNSVTMLTEDLIVMELLGKLNFITKHVEKYMKHKH